MTPADCDRRASRHHPCFGKVAPMPNSTRAAARRNQPVRVEKPSADFPLFPHQTGRWARKVKGRTVYFGRTDRDPRGVAALALWEANRADLEAGRVSKVLLPKTPRKTTR